MPCYARSTPWAANTRQTPIPRAAGAAVTPPSASRQSRSGRSRWECVLSTATGRPPGVGRWVVVMAPRWAQCRVGSRTMSRCCRPAAPARPRSRRTAGRPPMPVRSATQWLYSSACQPPGHRLRYVAAQVRRGRAVQQTGTPRSRCTAPCTAKCVACGRADPAIVAADLRVKGLLVRPLSLHAGCPQDGVRGGALVDARRRGNSLTRSDLGDECLACGSVNVATSGSAGVRQALWLSCQPRPGGVGAR